jgi:hypothetical protein
MEEEMILEPEDPDCALISISRALQQSSSAAYRHGAN